jgi:hypothetical protein
MYSYVGIAGLIVATIIPSLIGLFAIFTLKKEPTVSSKNVKTNSRIDFKDLVNTKIFIIQNKVIDELDAEEKRAEMLSVFNMGINVVEIVFLLFSALLVNAGIAMCFYIMGSLMIFISICGYVYSKSKICI